MKVTKMNKLFDNELNKNCTDNKKMFVLILE